MSLMNIKKSDIKVRTNRIMICACLCICLFSSSGCSRSDDHLFLDEETDDEIVVVTKESDIVMDIIVEIKGEVQKPGVYAMPVNSRLNDLLTVSGGVSTSANLRNVNLAMKIEDGESFYIPSIHDEEEEIILGEQKREDGKIDLNKASREDLMSVTGIGPATADNILAYREEVGKFNSVDELVQVNRIGDKTLEKIRDFFIVK
ncbi:MAG TPA: helix-hairpin-helix domain-containing protein [Proteiniclasticum sp.]|nr:helix-hairpin-helix domain-containing protein [Proteiniclasticum sp.]